MYTYIYNPVQLASIILSIIGRSYQHCWHSIIGQRLSIIRQCLVWQLHVSNMALDLLNIVHLNNSCIPPFSLLSPSSFLPPPSSSSLLSLSCRLTLTLSPFPSHSLSPSLLPSPTFSSPLKFVKWTTRMEETETEVHRSRGGETRTKRELT